MDHLSVTEAARTLGVSVGTIRRWCDTGQLDSFRTAGSHRRIPVDAVRAFRGQPPRHLALDAVLDRTLSAVHALAATDLHHAEDEDLDRAVELLTGTTGLIETLVDFRDRVEAALDRRSRTRVQDLLAELPAPPDGYRPRTPPTDEPALPWTRPSERDNDDGDPEDTELGLTGTDR